VAAELLNHNLRAQADLVAAVQEDFTHLVLDLMQVQQIQAAVAVELTVALVEMVDLESLL
jgi:hypothetical protein